MTSADTTRGRFFYLFFLHHMTQAKHFSPSTQKFTPYPELNIVLAELINGQKKILKDNLIGIYLQGSFAIGDFDIHSDADFITVTKNEPSESEVIALRKLHKRIFEMKDKYPWAGHIEGSYFSNDLLANNNRCSEKTWYVDRGSDKLIQSNHCNTLVVRWTLYEKAVVLFGPEAKTLMEEVTSEALRKEIFTLVHYWGDMILKNPDDWNSHFYQSFIVLSYCRILYSLKTGKVHSKRASANWAKENLDQEWHDLIDRSWSGRPDPAASSQRSANPEEYKKTIAFLRYAIRKSKDFQQEQRL